MMTIWYIGYLLEEGNSRSPLKRLLQTVGFDMTTLAGFLRYNG
jgi:hypothetical protein